MQIQYFNTSTYTSNQKLDNETCQCQCKNYRPCKKIIARSIAEVLVGIATI